MVVLVSVLFTSVFYCRALLELPCVPGAVKTFLQLQL